ncbi:WUSCHEL-related homeobox 11 [Zea mays]|uniref:WUSCHEL-related homeobox 11 n=1 Tax=Zea mays TaxID=4577 RepID=B6SN57_MAIZE|nr:WUSCHEL-related homeobox 11 [Zea mays]ACG26290.1 WUSCHEL-related homeobox 11 [Zea mays]|eukprot:NP_001147238.1 WUSCHEL-related homeobox 11 [Zea mays]
MGSHSHLGQALQAHHHHHHHHRGGECEPATAAAARSRWAPKPEQILILESIFNSGMVNPAKDETARIRRLLERFGAVRDANVFYWFQNRRSRSRRRARQLQQQQAGSGPQHPTAAAAAGHVHGANANDGVSLYAMHRHAGQQQQARAAGLPAVAPVVLPPAAVASSPRFFGDEIDTDGGDDLFAISRQMGLMSRGGEQHGCGYVANNDASQSHLLSYQPTGTATTAAAAYIQVSINGVVYEVPGAGALLDLAGTFGRDAMLVHSSGEILPVNENGVLMKSLQMGECYYLVSKST